MKTHKTHVTTVNRNPTI